MPDGLDTSMYNPLIAQNQGLNPLGIYGQTQDILAKRQGMAVRAQAMQAQQIEMQNAKALQAAGAVIQAATGSDGTVDYNKAVAGLASNPEVAPVAAAAIRNILDTKQVDASTVSTMLDNNSKQTTILGQTAQSVLNDAKTNNQGLVTPEAFVGAAKTALENKVITPAQFTAYAQEAHTLSPQDLTRVTKMIADRAMGVQTQIDTYRPTIENFNTGAANVTRAISKDTGAVTNTAVTPMAQGGVAVIDPKTGAPMIVPPSAAGLNPPLPTLGPQPLPFGVNGPQAPASAPVGAPVNPAETFYRPNAVIAKPLPGSQPAFTGEAQKDQSGGPASPAPGTAPPQSQAQSPAAVAADKTLTDLQNKTGLGPLEQSNVDSMIKYKNLVNEKVLGYQALSQQIANAQNILQKFKTGAGTSSRVDLAQLVQALPLTQIGVNPDTIKSIQDTIMNNPDGLANAQILKNIFTSMSTQSVKGDFGGQSRVSQDEWKGYQNNMAHIDSDPNAVQKILGNYRAMIELANIQQTHMDNYIAENGIKATPKSIQSDWENWANSNEKMLYAYIHRNDTQQ